MNMKFAALVSLGTLALVTAAPNAQAADNGFYLGAGITQTKFDVEDDGFGSENLDDNSFKAIAGFRPLNWLAFEANYLDLGGDEAGGSSLEATAITASALLLKEFGVVDIYARAGLAHWNLDASVAGLGSDSESGEELTYGAGIGVHFGSIGARLEYERFEIGDFDTDVGTVSLSVTYTFL